MRALLMTTLLVLAACGPPNPDPDGGVLPDGGPSALLVLGTTDANGGFVPLVGDVEAIAGSQGGFHVNVLYQLPEGAVGQVTFDHRVVRARDDKLVSLGTRVVDVGLFFVPAWASPAPITVFMCPTPVGVDVIGEELVFSAKAKDSTGKVFAAGAARATFRCNASSFCASICKG